jgi:hypothetical protein
MMIHYNASNIVVEKHEINAVGCALDFVIGFSFEGSEVVR